jgi:hypothetical protein
MRLKHRQFLSYVLLATYASISLLGDGLHSLLPAGEHQHHHGLFVVSHSCDDSLHAGHVREALSCGSSEYAEFTASDCDADSHICEVCEFLYQAISQPAEVAAPIDWQPLVVVVQADPRPLYSQASLGAHAPRGPPLLLA